MTLADVFELVITSDKDPRPGYLTSKMLDIRGVGKKAFISVVNYMEGLDYGNQCNRVWKSKYTQFTNAHRVKGSREHSWSVPITEAGKLLAKFRNGSQYKSRRRKKAANKTIGQRF